MTDRIRALNSRSPVDRRAFSDDTGIRNSPQSPPFGNGVCNVVTPGPAAGTSRRARFSVGESDRHAYRFRRNPGGIRGAGRGRPLSALAQVPGAVTVDPPGQRPRRQAARGRRPAPEPAPAPGTRYAKDREIAAPASRLAADAADAAETRANAAAAPAVVPPPVIGSHQIDRYDAIDEGAEGPEPTTQSRWPTGSSWASSPTRSRWTPRPTRRASISGCRARPSRRPWLWRRTTPASRRPSSSPATSRSTPTQFETSRDRYTDTYLDARRRDLAATGNVPYVKMYEPPAADRTLPGPVPRRPDRDGTATPGRPRPPPPPPPPRRTRRATRRSTRPSRWSGPATSPWPRPTPAVTPARTDAPATDAANYGTQQNYSAGSTARPPDLRRAEYRPFVTPAGTPFTYQQYSNSYFPTGVYNNPAVLPVTPQGYVAPRDPRSPPTPSNARSSTGPRPASRSSP